MTNINEIEKEVVSAAVAYADFVQADQRWLDANASGGETSLHATMRKSFCEYGQVRQRLFDAVGMLRLAMVEQGATTGSASRGKTYTITRNNDGHVIARVDGRPLTHVIRHSPTGVEFGYGGSGPADLALSILADHFGENPSDEDVKHGRGECFVFYQEFKWHFVAPAQSDTLIIEGKAIDEWLSELRRNRTNQ